MPSYLEYSFESPNQYWSGITMDKNHCILLEENQKNYYKLLSNQAL